MTLFINIFSSFFNFILLPHTQLTYSNKTNSSKQLRYLVDEDDERRNDIDLEDGIKKRKNKKNIMHAIDQIGKCISFLLSIISIADAEMLLYSVERDSIHYSIEFNT
jgi:hypothetical protein